MRRGFLYFMRAQTGKGPIKVGYSKYPWRRRTSLNAQVPDRLVVLHEMNAELMAEQYILETLKAHQHRGEWLKPHPFVLNFIDEIIRTGVIPGCPDPLPTCHNSSQRLVVDDEKLIPRIWASHADLRKAAGLVHTQKTIPATNRVIIRLIADARKRGVNLTTAELCRPLTYGILKPRKALKRRMPQLPIEIQKRDAA